MATSPLGPGDISLRDFIEAVGSAESAYGTVSTAAVAGGLGSSLLLMVAALPQTLFARVGLFANEVADELRAFTQSRWRRHDARRVIGTWPRRVSMVAVAAKKRREV